MSQGVGQHGASLPFVRKHRTFFAGLFLVIPIIVLPVLLVYTLMKAEFMQTWCHLYVTGENSYGLTRGSPVTISGMTIGHIQEVTLIKEGMIGIEFKIGRNYQRLIRKDTKARFQQKNIVVGDWIIDLTGGSKQVDVVDEYDTLQSIAPIRLDKTIKQVTSMVTLVETMINGVLDGKGTVGRLLTEDSLVEMVHGVGRNIDRLVNTTGKTLDNADTLLFELTALGRSGNEFFDTLNFLMQQVHASLEEVTVILNNLKEPSEDVGPLLKDLQKDIKEAERVLETLQKNWIYRKLAGRPEDPLLKENP